MNENKTKNIGNKSRRRFLWQAIKGSFAFSILPYFSGKAFSEESILSASSPRKGLGNMFLKEGKPVLLDISGADKFKRLEAGISKLENFYSLVKDRKVAIKPNTVAANPYPVCTDPEFVTHLCKILKDFSASEISIYDSSGRTASKFSAMGFDDTAKKLGIKLIPDDPGNKNLFLPVSRKDWKVMPVVDVSKHLYESEVIINMPTVKRHGEAAFSSAMKNHFGSVYGPNRWDNHGKLRDKKNPVIVHEEFLIPFRLLSAEFSDAVKSELTIADATDLLTKSGPLLAGAEIKKGVNRLFISGDIVACEVLCSKIMAENDDTYSEEMWNPVINYAKELGLGKNDGSLISIEKLTI